MTTQKKNNTIAASVTAGILVLALIVLYFVRLKAQDPPPPPKRVVMIELEPVGGGGGGGSPQATASPNKSISTGKATATQNADKTAPRVNKGTGKTEADNTPKVNNNAMYGKRGSGSGGGSGTGSGTGFGSGFGPGEGGGSGGGIGYGTGERKHTYMPDQSVREEGVVVVEVHINTAGTVVDAKVINSFKDLRTTITKESIRKECVAKAMQAKYVPGKEELRIIIFK